MHQFSSTERDTRQLTPEAVRDYRDQLERAGRTPATIYTAINDTRLEQAIDERSRRRRGAQRAAASN